MNIQEDIENLKKLRGFHNGSYGQSIKDAIEALEFLEFAENELLKSEKHPAYWIEEYDCEGKVTTYTCDSCGFDDGWKDYKWCPICGKIIGGIKHIEEI